MKRLMLIGLILCLVGGVTRPAPGAPSRAQFRQAQALLKDAGFDPGPLDGMLGPRTEAALRQYQAAHGLPSTGVLDAATRHLLLPAQGHPAGVSIPASASPLPGLVPHQIVVPKLLPMPQPVLVPKPPDPVPIPPIVLPTPEDRDRQREIQELLEGERQRQDLEKTLKREGEKVRQDQQRMPTPRYAPTGRGSLGGGGGRW